MAFFVYHGRMVWRLSRSKRNLLLTAAVVLTALQLYGARDLWGNRYTWDLVPIIGVAFSLDDKSIESVHSRTLQALRSAVPPEMYRELTQGPPDTSYRRKIAESPEVFQAQLPFYAIKFAHPAILWALSKADINPVDGASFISGLAYAVCAVIIFAWLAGFIQPLIAGALTLAITSNTTPLLLAIFPTPDALSSCAILFVFYLMSRDRAKTSLAVCVLAILIRPDTLLLLLLIAGWTFLRGHRAAAAGAAAIGIAITLVLAMWAGSYPWTTFFYHSFVGRVADPAVFVSPLTLRDYVAIYRTMFVLTVQHNFAFVAFGLLALLGIAARYRRCGGRDPYFAALVISLVYMCGLWFVTPWASERYLAPYYIVILIALIKNLVDAFEDRQGQTHVRQNNL